MIEDYKLHQRTEVWDYERYIQTMSDLKHIRCDFNRDLVVIPAGEEGSGKSKNVLATCCQIDKDFTIDNVFWTAEEYIKGQLATILSRYNKLSNEELALTKEFNIKRDELKNRKTFNVGGCLMSDEAGTQMYSRSSSTTENINQNKLFISNRALNLIHFILVPRPSSLDVYPRRDRARMLLWHDAVYKRNKDEYNYYVFGYSKDDYSRIYASGRSRWEIAFSDTRRLLEMFPPTFAVKLPDVNKYIPKAVNDAYDRGKLKFSAYLMAEMLGERKENGFARGLSFNSMEMAQSIVDGGDSKLSIYDLSSKYGVSVHNARKIKASVRNIIDDGVV